MNTRLIRIIVGFALYIAVYAGSVLLPLGTWFTASQQLYVKLVAFLVPYIIVGYDVLWTAVRNIGHGQLFDENFLMSIATLGAFGLVFFPEAEQHFAEAAAVMLFYQVGELFQDYAVDKSRKSISAMMEIAPDHATVERDGELREVDPEEVEVGELITIKPGERVPLDGTVETGISSLDTAAITGESLPRSIEPGDEIYSGCINLSSLITVRVTKPYGDSTVARVLELIENASEKKARTENFITRFARWYTPIVVGAAVALAVVPPLAFGLPWSDWVQRGLIFLVVSCPCALVISVPLSFFGGIAGASKQGILVKGGNYLEVLSKVETVVFDKTGTLTEGSFNVVAIHPTEGVDPDRLLSLAAYAEADSNHPIALSIREAYRGEIDRKRIEDTSEESGRGMRVTVDNKVVLVGNGRMMMEGGIPYDDCEMTGTVLHVAHDGEYIGHIVIADMLKKDAKQTIAELHQAGVKKTVMLTGDLEAVASATASELGIDEYHSQLLPQQKVEQVERLLETRDAKGDTGRLAFVGDGINDAPVLTRADVGIAMGAIGADAAIEAADIVLMDDKPSRIASAIAIARKTMRIVWQNIVFALGVKFFMLVLAAIGLANMWMAVFADVGVAIIAILNAMRAMQVKGGSKIER
ncbi:MAG: heavy metal translocating P-type ATPase [Eggerthellaceae bacterium]|jgi:Cd2+/Zn2+-exporting ATPase